ncbi:MAG TPA: 23S rRNA (guanosine(2251)-2'-O)-methyltransferase RlmB [Vicinamibacteria bacterium]|nr:23S rRNA (guanosine(2251)-2'-O)-methyltransferase RlmB [Vicinamibacteria bacterium]
MNLICGINPVLEALVAGTRHFDRLLVVKGLRNRRLSDAIRRATRLGIPLRFEMRETLDRMSAGVPHQGVIAVVSEKPVLSLESLLEAAHQPALVVVLDGVEDPRNLGAILRTAEAAGADGVLLPERHSAGLSETVARASAGALEHVRVARVGNLVQALEELKARGIWVVGFDAAGQERWDAVDLERPVALVLGGEGRGIRRLVREHCDHLVSIPHFGHVGSLNVSVAAGVALYEAVRQRRAVPSVVRPIPVRAAAAPHIVGPSADDAEDDPGARPSFELPSEAEDDLEAEASVTHADLHDEVAWGQGPTVLKPVGFEGPLRPHHRRRRGRDRPPRRDEPPASGQSGAHGGDGAPPGANQQAHEPGGRRKGRRRRRRRPGDRGPAALPRPEPGPPDGRPPLGEPSRAVEGPVPPGGDGRPPGAPGRRRRRRRR